MRAGEITAVRVDCEGRKFRITITVYLDSNSRIQFGGDILDFGDGTSVTVPETPTIPRPDLGSGIGVATFTVEHTYSSEGRFLIRYGENFRNANVTNLDNPLTTKFYLETSIIVPVSGCDSTPLLLVPPLDVACKGVAWFHNPGAFDPDGDSLSYELVVPHQDKDKPVANYKYPDSKEFYDKAGINYATANENGTMPPTFGIDPITGTIAWDAPGSPGEYNIAFVVKEWRKIEGIWVLLGYVERDMQILVSDCNNNRPRLNIPSDVCVEAGQMITADIFGYDPDSDSVRIEAFSEVFTFAISPAKMIPGPNNGNVKLLPSSPTVKAKIQFSWQTDCAHVRDQPYQVVLKVTDRPGSGGVRLVEFQTWNIKVVGPPPIWEEVVQGNRIATVKWNSYECQNAERVEVWRRVDRYPYTTQACVTGMPGFLGFNKIADVPVNQNSFTDSNGGRGLAAGAKYCYRLVAVFKQPRGGESYVSIDTCLAPIVADAPVITNASIVKTHVSDGEVQVRWRSAFDMNKIHFPPPYTFEVWRTEGISGAGDYTNLTPTRLTDSSFVDSSLGLNTEELIYSYRVIQFSHLRTDTSYVASTVRVEATPRVSKIEINWVANVPWSNHSYTHPYHLIYRGGLDDASITLIDSVDVNQNGLRYIDNGQYNDTPLIDSEVYCYYIQTRGTYGNPKIGEPLENFSQLVCAQPYDTVPPCIPVLNVSAPTCQEQAVASFCGRGPFRNVVTWNRATEACRADIRSYEIWVADKKGAGFTFYRDNVRDTFFIDTNQNLHSFARCYKVLAVDRAGNKSELSEDFCFDNCANYKLPNVFTPNGDSHNEHFSAFGDQSQLGPGEPGMAFFEDCARFVESVDFVVFNRWGAEVYRASDLREDHIYVAWDGRDNEGRDLDGGVYYYRARVRFITVDPDKEVAEMKGWLQLIR